MFAVSACTVKETSASSCLPPARKCSASTASGSVLDAAPGALRAGATTAEASSIASIGRITDHLRHDIHAQRQHQQYDAQCHRQRQIALAGFQRNGGSHDAAVMIDVAANDHDRAD